MLTALALALAPVASGYAANSGPSSSPSASSGPTPGGTSAKNARATWGVQPASNGKPDARALFAYGLTPTGTAFDHVAIVNYGKLPLRLGIYPTDAFTAQEGGFALLPGAQRARDAGSWISLGSHPAGGTVNVTVPAATLKAPGMVILPVAITVPANAQPGDHSAGIVASSVTLGKNPQGQNVRLDQRVASRVYLRVTGPLSPALRITGFTTRYHPNRNPFAGGTVTVDYTVVNSGNVRMGFEPAVSVTGLGGALKKTVHATTFPELLPGSAHTFHETVAGVWPTFRLTTSLTLQPTAAPGSVAPGLADVSASSTTAAVPWALLVILGLLVTGWWYLRRRRRARGSSGPGRGSKSDGGDSPRGPSGPRSGEPAVTDPREKVVR